MHTFSQLLHQSQPLTFNVLRAGTWEMAAGKGYPLHRHTSWEIVYYRSGYVEGLVGDDIYEGRPGVLLAIPPGVMHGELAHIATQDFWIQFDGPEIAWPRLCVDDAQHSIGQLCAAIVRECQEQPLKQDEMNALLLGQLYILLMRMAEQPKLSAAERMVRHVEIIMAERYTAPLKVNELAREVGVSDTYLRAQFVRLRGTTPSEHMQTVRVRHAVTLLQTSTLTLETIAETCGYNSASHLTRHIKRATGKTPGALRRD